MGQGKNKYVLFSLMVIAESGAMEQTMTEKKTLQHFYWVWWGELDSGESDLHFCVPSLHQR